MTWCRATHLAAHAGAGLALAVGAWALLERPILGLILATTVGLGKELRDWRERGGVAFDWAEWGATVAGAALEVLAVWWRTGVVG